MLRLAPAKQSVKLALQLICLVSAACALGDGAEVEPGTVFRIRYGVTTVISPGRRMSGTRRISFSPR